LGMMKRYEYLTVPLEKDEDEPVHPELEPPGEFEFVSPNDPRLQVEEWIDPAADAYATSVRLKSWMDMRGVMADSISTQW
jgi:hypothetical protein